MIDDECWKRVWAEMTDSELEHRLFTYLWLSFRTPNSHADRVAQLIAEAERRGQAAMVERARVKAGTTLAATEPDTLGIVNDKSSASTKQNSCWLPSA